MSTQPILVKTALSALGLSLALFASPRALAQSETICLQTQLQKIQSKPTAPSGAVTAAKIDPREEAEYKAFFKLKPEELDRRMEAGDAFVQKYADGPFTEAVYSQLTTAAYQKQDFARMETYADHALALNPDDVTVLVFVGWVIPHSASPAPAQLDKAEKFERHALELLPTLAKPAGMSDAQLATAKSEYDLQAHSALGLVDYRRENFQGAATELNQATAGASRPDPADFYVLGVSLDRLDRFSDAASAFSRCAAIPGAEQATCHEHAEAAKKLASTNTATASVTQPNQPPLQ
jgi:tetratricopeptide (TPR) repeat protein